MKKYIHTALFLLVTALGLAGCNAGSESGSHSDRPDTSDFDHTDYDALKELILTDDPGYEYEIGSMALYVDAGSGSDDNDGSEHSPFATITHALEQASGGEVIYVADGHYGDLQFGAYFYPGSDKSTPIAEVFPEWVTLKAMDGQYPVLDHVTLGTWHDDGGWFSIDFDQLGNSDLRLRIDGFTITDNVSIYGSRHVEIRNCLISQKGDFAAMSEDEKSEYMEEPGIGVYNGQYVTLLFNEITDTGVGIWAMTTDLVVKGNHIHHITHDGIQMHGGKNWLVENNVIHDLDDGTGDQDGSGYNMHVDGVHMYIINPAAKYAHRLDNLVFRGNLIYHAESMDVMINSTSIEGGGYGNFVWENNIFGPSNGYLFIMGAVVADGHVFRHNTVLYTPNDQWTSRWGRQFGQGFGSPGSDDYYIQTWWSSILTNQSDYYFYNNILVKTSSNSLWTSGGDRIMAYNNLYYTGNSDQTLDNHAGYEISVLPYEAIDTNIQDVVEKGNLPGYMYSGSPAIDAGYDMNDIDSYSRDFAGHDRDSAPDIGAWEFY